jgi:predicted outer membrane repeat protein
VRNGYVQSNESERFGGGVAAYTALTTTLNRNRFVANTAAGGGGACVWRAILSYNAFISNTVVGDGGAVYVNGYGTIRQNAFVSNTAGWNGGAVFHLGGIEYVDQYIENTFSGNEARHGGALFLDASNVLLERNTFVSNIADQDGGAVIGLADSGVRFVNSQVVDNYAGNSGSGLFIGTSSLDILHATIARNTGGDGSGIYVNDGSVALTNTLIASQTVGIYVTNGQTATLEGTGWGAGVWANGVDWAGAGTILTGTVNVWGAPAFVDPDGGNYHISVHSAAVDAGVDAGVVTDIDGEERPIGFGPDIGADEVWRRIYSFYLPILHR